MPERHNIHSRRAFILAALSSVLAPNFINSAYAETSLQSSLQAEKEKIKAENALIASLFPPASQNYSLILSEGNKLTGKVYCTVNNDSTRFLQVMLTYPDDAPKTLFYGQVVGWHEIFGHGFDLSNENKPAIYVAKSFDPLIKPTVLSHELRTQRYSPLTESTYLQDKDVNIGHPWSNWSEIFASGSTVARFFMSNLIMVLQSQPRFAPDIANTVLRIIESYSKFSSVPINIKDLPFDKRGIHELQRIGQGKHVILNAA